MIENLYLPRRLSHYEIFIDGRIMLGKCEEFEPPKIESDTYEYRASCFDAPMDIEKGMKKLEAKITLHEYDHLVMRRFLETDKPVSILARGALTYKNTSGYAHFSMRGFVRNLDFGKWKAGDDSAKLSFDLTCSYYRIELDGVEILEIDIPNMVRKIGGIDQLAMARAAILKV